MAIANGIHSHVKKSGFQALDEELNIITTFELLSFFVGKKSSLTGNMCRGRLRGSASRLTWIGNDGRGIIKASPSRVWGSSSPCNGILGGTTTKDLKTAHLGTRGTVCNQWWWFGGSRGLQVGSRGLQIKIRSRGLLGRSSRRQEVGSLRLQRLKCRGHFEFGLVFIHDINAKQTGQCLSGVDERRLTESIKSTESIKENRQSKICLSKGESFLSRLRKRVRDFIRRIGLTTSKCLCSKKYRRYLLVVF